MEELLIDALAEIARNQPQAAFDGVLAAIGKYDPAALDTFEPETKLLDALTGQPLAVRTSVGMDLRDEEEVDEDEDDGSYFSVALTTFADGTRMIEVGMNGIVLVHRADDALAAGSFCYMYHDKLEGYQLHGQLAPGDFNDRDEALKLLHQHGILDRDTTGEQRDRFLRRHGLAAFILD